MQPRKLLKRPSKSRRPNDSAVPLVAVPLDLAPAFAAALGAALKVGVELGGGGVHLVDVLGELAANEAQLAVGSVAPCVEGVVVDGALGQEGDLGVECAETAKASVCLAADGAVLGAIPDA